MGGPTTSAPVGPTTIKSYSTELEDVLAANVLAKILKRFLRGGGVYLDIGAAHPVNHSNTYLCYTHGWRGYCVEPNSDLCALYANDRPKDRIFNFGIAPTAGKLTYHRFENYLLNGFLSQEVVDSHIRRGRNYLGPIDMECVAIGEFLRAEIKEPVDFLSIDVEMMEPKIFSAWDWEACRPSVICVEIHSPDIKAMLNAPAAVILGKSGYTAVSRGLSSAIFLDASLIK